MRFSETQEESRPRIIALAQIIIDDLRFADGRERRGILGGAGSYAVAGMRLVTGRVGIVSGVGADFASALAPWFRENDIDIAGLEIRAERTPRSWVVYQHEDTRSETPQLGADHFARMAPQIANLPAGYRQARAIYAFRDAEERFWEDLLRLREDTGATLLWELHEAAARPERWPAVARLARAVDIVSLNRSEAESLSGHGEPLRLAEQLLEAGARAVALRLGAAGALVATAGGGCWRVPAYETTLRDPTGAGNAFSGALLAARTRGEDWPAATCGAAAAASFMLEQHGPPPRLRPLQPIWQERKAWLAARQR